MDYLNPLSNNFILRDVLTYLSYLNPLSDNFILNGVLNSIGSILDYLNPFSNKFILKDVLTSFSSILSYLNPFSENFILKDVISSIGRVLDYLNPFSENFILNGVGTSISNIYNSVSNFFSSFFNDFTDFFIHIFIPTEEQWTEIEQDYNDIVETVTRHFPFVGLFSEELQKAQDTVEKTDFLVIQMPSFTYEGSGGIGVTTDEQRIINVSQVYEPYRAYVRGFLFLIVVGLAGVYLVKYFLNYGDVGSVFSGIARGSKGGDK